MDNFKRFIKSRINEVSVDEKSIKKIEDRVFKKENKLKLIISNNYFRYSLMVILLLVIVSIPLDNNNTNSLTQSVSNLFGYQMAKDDKSRVIQDDSSGVGSAQGVTNSPSLDYSGKNRLNEHLMSSNAKFKYIVVDIWDSLKKLNSLISSTSSFVTENTSNTNGASLLISVPIEKMDLFQQELRKIGSKIIFEEIKSTDIQNQYNYDTKWIAEYKSIIKDLEIKLSKETDKDKKADISQQIVNNKSWLKSREDSLDETMKKASYATVYVEFVQDNDSFSAKLGTSVTERLQVVQNWSINALGWLIYLTTIGIPIGIIVFIVKIFVRRKQK